MLKNLEESIVTVKILYQLKEIIDNQHSHKPNYCYHAIASCSSNYLFLLIHEFSENTTGYSSKKKQQQSHKKYLATS